MSKKIEIDRIWLEEQYVSKRRSMKNIADELGICAQAVCDRIHEYGIPTERIIISEALLRGQYVDKKMSAPAIAATLGVSENTIYDRMERYGIPVRSLSEARRGELSPRYGKHHTPESKAKMSLNRKGKCAGENNYLYGKHLPEETRAKIGAARKGKYTGENSPNYGKKFSDERKAAISRALKGTRVGKKNNHYGIPNSPETRAKISAAVKGKLVGPKNPNYGRPPRHGKGEWYTCPDGTEVWMRSSYEVQTANALTMLNIKWKYEPRAFPLEGTTNTYTPDFYLPEYHHWIEVKGWMRSDAKDRLERFFKQYPRKSLKIIRLPDIELLESYALSGQPFDITQLGNTEL